MVASTGTGTGTWTQAPELIGPYAIYGEIGCGGMATVHIGQLRSASGFTRMVAIKRMHPELARSPEFVAMFFEEARLSGRIQHPNVVAALDCVVRDGTAILVMDYVHGVALDQALRQSNERKQPVPINVGAAILVDALMGLHAAHEAVDQTGKTLGIVHRDVSPHNIMVGADGVARVLDFGIAKAAERARHTRTGEIKGKLGYMAPEQLYQEDIGRSADIYSIGVVLWELLTGQRMFGTGAHAQIMMRIANNEIPLPSKINPEVTPEIEALVMKALARMPEDRFPTALDFAAAIEKTIEPAYPQAVSDWIRSVANERLMELSELRARVDADTPAIVDDPSAPVLSMVRTASDIGVPSGTAFPSRRSVRPVRSLRSAGAALLGAGLVAGAAFFLLRGSPAPASPTAHAQGHVAAVEEPTAHAATLPEAPATSASAVAASASVAASTAAKPAEPRAFAPTAAPFRHTRAAANTNEMPPAMPPAAAVAHSASVQVPPPAPQHTSDLEVIGGRE